MLIGYDGFDNYATPENAESRLGGLQWFLPSTVGLNSGGVSIVAGAGRGASPALLISAHRIGGGECFTFWTAFFTNADPLCTIGMALDLTTATGDFKTITFMDANTSNTEQIHFIIDTGPSKVEAWRGSTKLGESAINIFTTSGYNYFEFQSLTDNVGGTAVVRINGQTVLNLTGIDTQQSTNAWVSGCEITVQAGPPQDMYMDDFYVLNGISSGGTYPNNSFLGSVHVTTLYPTGNSTPIGWTPLTGTNWGEVSEHPFDGDASYNFTVTAPNTDMFNMQVLAGTVDAIICVQAMGAYRQTGYGNHTIAQLIKSGATTGAGASWGLTTSYQFMVDLFPLNPNTAGTWTLSQVNAMTAGYEATA